MLNFRYPVAGDTVSIRVPETENEFREAVEWAAARPREVLAIDTETTGLAIYSPGFAVRTFQIGDSREAWVLRLGSAAGDDAAATILREHPRFVAHNAPFDIQSLARVGLTDLDGMLHKTFDTYILAHLLDPRAQGEDGAVGLSLKALSTVYVDPDAQDAQQALKATFKRLGVRKLADGWAHPDLPEDETYLTYAGLDVVYTSRLLAEIGPIVRSLGFTELAKWEHRIQEVTTRMSHRGVLVDVDYTERLVEKLRAEAEHYKAIAARYGVSNVNSVAQVRDALLAMDVKLTKRTATGNLSVGKDALLPLAGLTPYWDTIPDVEVNPLAEAVVRAKRAEKWRVAYAEAFLAMRDENDRLHPGIKSLAARTGRMSIANPPLQQLPSGGWEVRRCLIADPGKVFVSTDLSQVELRVLAANAGVANMKAAVADGVDMHSATAALIFGEGYSKRQRGIAKAVGFCYVYGGGANKIAETAGITVAEATDVLNAYKAAYPELEPYGHKLQRDASQDGWAVRTMTTNRRLPLSRDRSYAATNFCTQSAARDLFASYLLKLSAEMDDRLSLVVHDEVLLQAAPEEAREVAIQSAHLMSSTYRGVKIDSEAEVFYGGSWASGYKVPAELDRSPEQHERAPFVYTTAGKDSQ